MDSCNLDYMGICLDEIALEGLDGITMPSLWKRLEKHGKFPLTLDDPTKQFIWDCILQHNELSLFLLEEARLPLMIYNRYNNVDLEMGIVMDADESAYEIYPHAPIQSIEVKGSCSTFSTRKNVSAELKLHGRNYFITMHRFGEERIVVVASQELRTCALLGTEVQPNIELSLDQYCLLERIGRSRYHGEVTMGRLSLSQMKIQNKKMFYIRKVLMKRNLITKQIHLQRVGASTQHSSLLHLRRFYVERLSKAQVMVMKMCEILKNKPNKTELFNVIRSELGMKEGSFKKMFNKTFQVCVQAKMIPYGEYFPDAPKEKRFALNGKERQVKIAVLVKNYEDPEDDDFDDEDEEKNEVRFSMDPRRMTLDRPILSQLYNEVEKAGPNGITSNSLMMDLGISKLDIRLLLRNLERRNAIFSVMQDMGRQRSAHYIAKCFEEENFANNQLLEMKQKILSYSSTPAPIEDYHMDESPQKIMHPDVFNELSSVTVDFLEDDHTEVLTKAWNFSLKDIFSACKAGKDKEGPNFTYKMLKRVNMVIEAVRLNRLVEDPFRIQKLIFQAEQEEGLTEKIDKKSTHRIISRLAKDGYIRSIKTRLTMGNTVKKLHFICDSSVTPDDPLVQSAIEQAKLKYFSISKDDMKSSLQTASPEGLSDSGFQLRNLTDLKDSQRKLEYIPAIGRSYGLLPKFLRMKSLHLFLFYLVYDYEGTSIPVQIKDENSPAVYHLSETWKRFVPPLPHHAGKGKGWCLVSDVILSMPLSLLLKVVNYTYRIEGLEVFTDDHIKQHYLLRHLPQGIRNLLLHSRKYIFSVHEVLTKLTFMGLLSFGPQQYKEKDQIFVYVHQNTSIKDTTCSDPGFTTITPDLNYTINKYHMGCCQDVENYWYDLENICMRTPLGASRNSGGKVKNIFNEPAMIEASRQKTVEEICDESDIPGDGLGAAGLDSAMFSHLRRNWSWPADSAANLKCFSNRKEEPVVPDACPVGISYMKYLAEKDEEVSVLTEFNKTKRLSRLAGKSKLILPEQQVAVHASVPDENISKVQKSIVPNIVNRKGYKRKCSSAGSAKPAKRIKKTEKRYKLKKKDKIRKPYYDEKDRIALNKMSKQRVAWSVQEDSFLLLCKVSSCFLDPHHKGVVIPFSSIREIMHSRFPTLSYNKTSRACQRRINFMMRNPTTVANVSVFLLEAKQDVELVRQFQGPKPIKRDEETWTHMFTTVLNHLLEKFTLSLKDRCTLLSLPNDIDELNKYYTVSVTGDIKDKKCAHVEPKNTVDIYCSVMFCFILSSMFTIGDKNNWSYTLYRVYQQYPDSLLRSVVARLKRDRLVTKRKDMNLRTDLTIPLSSLPHKLSVHFEMNLQPRYQPHIYDRAALLFKKMTADYSLPEPKGVKLSGHIEPGDTALILSLNATENVIFDISVPEQVVIFDSCLTDDLKSRIQQKVKEYEKEDAKELAETEGETSGDTPFEVSSSRASRIALYMLRHELGASVSDNLQHAQDYFLINTCELNCTLRLPELKKWYPLSPFKAQCAMDLQRDFLPLEVLKPTPEITSAAYKAHSYPDDITQDGINIVMHILESKEQGCSFEEMYTFPISGELSIQDHLKFLVFNKFLLRVGVTCFRYVLLFYCKPWVINAIKVLKDDRSAATEVATQKANEELEEQKQAKRAKLSSNVETNMTICEAGNDVEGELTSSTDEQKNAVEQGTSNGAENVDVGEFTSTSSTEQQNVVDQSTNDRAENGVVRELIPSYSTDQQIAIEQGTSDGHENRVVGEHTLSSNTAVEQGTSDGDENRVLGKHTSSSSTAVEQDTNDGPEIGVEGEHTSSSNTAVEQGTSDEAGIGIVGEHASSFSTKKKNAVEQGKNNEKLVTEVGAVQSTDGEIVNTSPTLEPDAMSNSEVCHNQHVDEQTSTEASMSTADVSIECEEPIDVSSAKEIDCSEILKDLSDKISSFSSSAAGPESVVACADSLFQLAKIIFRMFSGENIVGELNCFKDSIPSDLLEMFQSTGGVCQVMHLCSEKYALQDLIDELSKTEFVKNVSNFLAALEESPTVKETKQLFHSVFCVSSNTPDANVILVTNLLNDTLSRGFELLLKVYKFNLVLKFLNSFSNTVTVLKNRIYAKEASMLKDWFEEKLMVPVEFCSLSAIQKDVPKKLSCHLGIADLKEPLKTGKSTIDSAVEICVDDLLKKVNDSEYPTSENLADWFKNSVLLKIESEELRDWLENFLLNELDKMIEEETLREWLLKKVMKHIENVSLKEYRFIERWLEETVLSKITEEQESLDICKWVNEIIENVSNSEKHSLEEKNLLQIWLNDTVLKKVEALNESEIECSLLRNWLEENVLSIVDNTELTNKENHQCILKVLNDAINVIEDRENFISIKEKLHKVLEEVTLQEESFKELQKWFYESLINRIQEHTSDYEEIVQWFEENLLRVLETTSKSNNVDFKEVQAWLEEELNKLLNTTEPVISTSELQVWFEQNILKVLLDFEDENSHVKECLNNVLEDIEKTDFIGVVNMHMDDQVLKDNSSGVETCVNGMLDVVQTTLELVDSKQLQSINENSKTLIFNEVNKTSAASKSAIENQSEANSCLNDNILDVVETTSNMIDNICNADVSEQSSSDDVYDSLSPEETEIVVSDILNSLVLDVIEVTSELVNTVGCSKPSISETAPQSQNSISNSESGPFFEQKTLPKQSVIDAVNEMSALVNSVNALIEVMDDGQSTPTCEQSTDSPTDLNKNLLEAISATYNLVNSASNLQEGIDLDQEKPNIKDSLIETDNSGVCPMDVDDCEIPVSPEVTTCLQTQILDVIDTTTDMLNAVTIANQDKTVLDAAKCLQNDMVDVVDSVSFLLDSVEKPLEHKSSSSLTTEVADCFQENVLDVVEAVSNIIDSVNQPNECEILSVTTAVSECLEHSVLDVIDTASVILDNLTVLPITDHNSNLPIQKSVLDIVEDNMDILDLTSELINSVPDISSGSGNADPMVVSEPRTSAENLLPNETGCQDLSIENSSARGLETTSKTRTLASRDGDVDQEGRGKRKRKRPVHFETKTTNRMASYDQIRFVSRPWRKPDGTLNRKTLEKHLVAVLGHIMTNPGVSEVQIFEKFEPTMQPIFVLELLEILSECECISTYHVTRSHMPGLFTVPASYNILKKWQPGSETHYEGTVDAILKLSYFLSDFLHYRH